MFVSTLQPGLYIASIYEKKWRIGNKFNVSIEEHDVLVNFMHPNGPANAFRWPELIYSCWVPEQHITAVIPTLSVSAKRRQEKFPQMILRNIDEQFSSSSQLTYSFCVETQCKEIHLRLGILGKDTKNLTSNPRNLWKRDCPWLDLPGYRACPLGDRDTHFINW